MSGTIFVDFLNFWRHHPTKAQLQYSTTAATWEAFDPSRYSPGSPELARMQDATGNGRVGMLGGSEYSDRLGGLDWNFSAETATAGDAFLDTQNDLREGNSISSELHISRPSSVIITVIQLSLRTRLAHLPPVPKIPPSPKIPKNDPYSTYPISTTTHRSEALVAVQSCSVSGRKRTVVRRPLRSRYGTLRSGPTAGTWSVPTEKSKMNSPP